MSDYQLLIVGMALGAVAAGAVWVLYQLFALAWSLRSPKDKK